MKRSLLCVILSFLIIVGVTCSIPIISKAASGSIEVQMYNGSTSSTANSIAAYFKLINNSSSSIDLSNITLRYYYTKDGTQSQNFWCDWSSAGSSYVTGTFGTLSTAVTGTDSYLQLGFTSGAGTLASGSGMFVQIRFAKNDWSSYTQTNDYSFNSTSTAYTDWTMVTAYNNGTLIWGTEPTGSSSSSSASSSTSSTIVDTTTVSAPTAKKVNCGNPLIDYKYGADPYALVYNNKVYLYMTNDAYVYSNGSITDNVYSTIKTISVISSADLVNWTDEGIITVAGTGGAATWASNSWAPSVCCKKINGVDKFFLYFANSAASIGVLTANSPTGPWTDPIGKALITKSTSGCSSVTWLFDPAVLVDDDGTGYLYFGGGVPGTTQSDYANPKTVRVIKLGSDMTSVSGSAATIDAPFAFEDSGIHKYNGKYYYSYCSNFGGTHPSGSPATGVIAYMVSSSPMSGFSYVGTVLNNPYSYFGVGGNNHHSIFQFNNEWYIAYHAQTLGKALGIVKGYRSPHINKVTYDSSGKMNLVSADMTGVSQTANINPFNGVEAETIAWQYGIATETCTASGCAGDASNMEVTSINNADWTAVSKVDFGTSGASAFTANVSSTVGGRIVIRTDSATGTIIGALNISSTGSETTWKQLSCSLSKVTGVHNVYLIFEGSGSSNLFNLDYWKLTQ